MKTYNSLHAMVADRASKFVVVQVQRLLTGTRNDPTTADIKNAPEIGEDFEYWYGGHINVVETVEDLKKIATYVESEITPGEYASLHEAPTTADQVFYFPGREWAMFWIATNNNGGPSYFIPKSVIDNAPGNTIEESMILTHGKIVEETWGST